MPRNSLQLCHRMVTAENENIWAWTQISGKKSNCPFWLPLYISLQDTRMVLDVIQEDKPQQLLLKLRVENPGKAYTWVFGGVTSKPGSARDRGCGTHLAGCNGRATLHFQFLLEKCWEKKKGSFFFTSALMKLSGRNFPAWRMPFSSSSLLQGFISFVVVLRQPHVPLQHSHRGPLALFWYHHLTGSHCSAFPWGRLWEFRLQAHTE